MLESMIGVTNIILACIIRFLAAPRLLLDLMHYIVSLDVQAGDL